MTPQVEEVSEKNSEILIYLAMAGVWLAIIFLICADIHFSIVQSTTVLQCILNSMANTAITLFGLAIFTIAAVKRREEGFKMVLIPMWTLGIAVFFVKVVAMVGWKSTVDYDYMTHSAVHIDNEKRKSYADEYVKSAKVEIDPVSTRERIAELRKQVAAQEDAAKMCSGNKKERKQCKNTMLSGVEGAASEIDSLEGKLSDRDKYLSAIKSADATIELSNGNRWSETMLHYQGLADLFYDTPEQSLKAQTAMRLLQSLILMSIIDFGFVFTHIRSKKVYDTLAKAIVRPNERKSPTFDMPMDKVKVGG